MTTAIFATPLGSMTATSKGGAITSLRFTPEASPSALTEDRMLARLECELAEYFAGDRRSFGVALAPAGTPFQRRAWDALLAIPMGETRSYAAQAAAIGKPSAVRAVAKANADNSIAIVIPCHRVIASNGALHGYAGELWRKRRLLELEGAIACEGAGLFSG